MEVIRTGVFMAPFALVVVVVQRLWPGASVGEQAVAVLLVGYFGAQALAGRVPRPLTALVLGGAGLLAWNLLGLGLGQVWPG